MKLSMKFGAAATAIALCMAATAAHAADALTLQLKWVAQAQFAGYYVAKAKGFYDAEGLDVTIKAGGPDVNPSQVIAGAAPMWSSIGCPRLWPPARRACRWSTSPRCSRNPA